jgi:small GTP-binding protein
MGLNHSKRRKNRQKIEYRPPGCFPSRKSFDSPVKIGLLGDEKVGKTSICHSFVNLNLPEDYITTIGYEKFEKKELLNNGKEVRLIIWDSGGQERFRSSIISTLRHVEEIIIVFDVTNRKSFDDIENWLEIIKERFNDPVIILFGNKVDVKKEEWKVTEEEINLFCTKKKLKYFGTSAKNNNGIKEGFSYLANIIFERVVK